MVDGDKSLVLSDKTIIGIAKRNIAKYNIVPLYYNMRKAPSVELNKETIYNSLIAAFTGSNIGIYSNNISKIWNSDVFIYGDFEEQQRALNIIKLLCCENNFKIDYAKALYMPERPKTADDLISSFTKGSLPHFFKYAKDKEETQVACCNNSVVNRLNSIIPDSRISYRGLGLNGIDYTLLMSDPSIEFNVEITEKGKIIKEKTHPLIARYHELNKKHYLSLDKVMNIEQSLSPDVSSNSLAKQSLKYHALIKEIKDDLSMYGENDTQIADILVKYLYGIKKSKHKLTLWLCYGDILYSNLEKHLKSKTKDVECVDCGKWFNASVKDNQTTRCPECYAEYRKVYLRKKQREQRAKKNVI